MQDWLWLVRFLGYLLLFITAVLGVIAGVLWFINWSAKRWSAGLHKMRVGYHQGLGENITDLPKHDWDSFERRTWWLPVAAAMGLGLIVAPYVTPFVIPVVIVRGIIHSRRLKEQRDANRACLRSEESGRRSAR